MSTILDTPNQIELFHLLQMKYALKIEIKTGLHHSRGSVLKLVNDTFGWKHRTKQAAYDALCKHIDGVTAKIVEDPA